MKNLRGEPQKPENNDDCRVLAPFVMTLFDGEADEIEARRARAHLLVCQTCANRWLDWNRSRDLLLHSAPVPAPPPQLLWRVLMACRLSKAPRRAQTTAPTANLSAQILARTTRVADAPAPRTAPRRIFAPLSFPALAAPALCVWMLLLQRDVWLAPTVSAPDTANFDSLVIGTATAPRPLHSVAKTSAPKRAALRNPSGARRSNTAAISRSARVEVRSPPARAASSAGFVVRSRPETGAEANPGTLAAPLAATQALRVIEASFGTPSGAEWGSAARLEAAPVQRSAAPRQFDAPRAAPRRALRRLPAARLAALSDNRAPRLRAARFASAPLAPGAELSRAARLSAAETPASTQILRVALPSAPAPQPARLLAEFDADDERIEEARSVVDEFRAAVDPEANSLDTTAGDEENAG